MSLPDSGSREGGVGRRAGICRKYFDGGIPAHLFRAPSAATTTRQKQDHDERTGARRRPADLAAVAVSDPGVLRPKPKHVPRHVEPRHAEQWHRARLRRRLVRPARPDAADRAARRRRQAVRFPARLQPHHPAARLREHRFCRVARFRRRLRSVAARHRDAQGPDGAPALAHPAARCEGQAPQRRRRSADDRAHRRDRGFLPKARRHHALEDLAAGAARGHVRHRRGDAVLPAHALGPALRAAAARRRDHQARDRRLGPHAAAVCRRRRHDDLSAGLSAGAQRPAGGQLFGARHRLPAAQRARPPGLRLSRRCSRC